MLPLRSTAHHCKRRRQTMGIGNILLLSQATGYGISLILSLCLLIPMCVHVDKFKGHCLLYTTGSFREDDGSFVAKWASFGYCGFSVTVGAILMIGSFVQVVRMSVYLYNGTDSSFLSAFMDTVANLFVTLCVFVDAVLITEGFRTWCDAVSQRFASCENASLMSIDKADGIDTIGFYLVVGTAQFGAWSSWVCWVFLTVLSTRKLCVYHERENIIVSMARERQRLLNGGGLSPDQET